MLVNIIIVIIVIIIIIIILFALYYQAHRSAYDSLTVTGVLCNFVIANNMYSEKLYQHNCIRI